MFTKLDAWLVVFITIILLRCTTNRTDEFTWRNLKNLGARINSEGKDEHVTLTRNGKTMFFASDRIGGLGGYDLYISHFEDGEWSEAELLPSPLNTERDEFDPFITLDGATLFFASNRHSDGPYWDCDIYVSEWDGKQWREPHIFDSVFVTPGKPDWGVAITEDFKVFIFSSGREPAKDKSVQIFQSLWLGERWSQPRVLPVPVNSGMWEATPYITPDGKTLYVNSARGEEGKKDVDIWMFELHNGTWTNPQLMSEPMLSDKHDYDPCVSPDGEKFYFTSNRDGGLGNSDIYVAEKIYTQKK